MKERLRGARRLGSDDEGDTTRGAPTLSPRLSADNRDLLARVGVRIGIRIGIRIGDGDGGGDGFFVLRLFLLAVEVAFGMIGVVQVGFQVMRNRFLNAVEIRDVQYLVGI